MDKFAVVRDEAARAEVSIGSFTAMIDGQHALREYVVEHPMVVGAESPLKLLADRFGGGQGFCRTGKIILAWYKVFRLNCFGRTDKRIRGLI